MTFLQYYLYLAIFLKITYRQMEKFKKYIDNQIEEFNQTTSKESININHIAKYLDEILTAQFATENNISSVAETCKEILLEDGYIYFLFWEHVKLLVKQLDNWNLKLVIYFKNKKVYYFEVVFNKSTNIQEWYKRIFEILLEEKFNFNNIIWNINYRAKQIYHMTIPFPMLLEIDNNWNIIDILYIVNNLDDLKFIN